MHQLGSWGSSGRTWRLAPGRTTLRDVVEVSSMKIALPVGGVGAVAVVQPEVVGGVGFEALLEKALRGPLAAL